ncbi:hypothetical protein [Paraburkholderia sp. SIMBA_053]|uniref:hypothetical protein n=1 Tax=Paraburkholderia sp. SIMBA_053 TaxID=3085794 RepID=UPI003979F628
MRTSFELQRVARQRTGPDIPKRLRVAVEPCRADVISLHAGTVKSQAGDAICDHLIERHAISPPATAS